jgi:hypothetical protein
MDFKSDLPIINLPSDVQVCLCLIREELKSRKLFQVFQKAGLDDCWYQPHLDSLIMHSLGMDDGTDEVFTRYDDIMEKRSHKIEPRNDSVMKQALKVYHELLEVKKSTDDRPRSTAGHSKE